MRRYQQRLRPLLLPALFVLVAIVVFGGSLQFGFLSFDDSYLVVNNPVTHGPTLRHIARAFSTYDPELYIPLTLVSYQLNYLVGGLQPFVYHLTNIVLHGLNGFLVFLVLSLVLRDRRTALLLGLLYTVHPLNTEAAVWVSARKDVLSTFFLLLSIFLHQRSLERNDGRVYMPSVLFYGLAALSKPSVLILPVLLPLLHYARSDGRRMRWKSMWPYAVIALLTAAVALVGKTHVASSSSVTDTAVMAARSSAFYLQKFLMPLSLSPIYPHIGTISLASAEFLVPIVILTLLALTCVVVARRSPMPLACFVMFLVTISPSFLNFHKGEFMYVAVDRYAYVAIIWLLLLVGTIVSGPRTTGIYRRIIECVLLCTIAVCGALSIRQTSVWNTDETLFRHVLSLAPESAEARMSLAAWYRESGRRQSERQILEEGLRLKRSVALLLGLGSLEAREGNGTQARSLYEEAKKADPGNPEPYFYEASLDEEEGKTDIALEGYRKALSMDPSYVAAAVNLGAAELDRGNLTEAEAAFSQAVHWNPNSIEARYNLFLTLSNERKYEEAFPHLVAAEELAPDNPDILLAYGFQLKERGDARAAAVVLRHLLRIDPANHTANRLLMDLDQSFRPAKPSRGVTTPSQPL